MWRTSIASVFLGSYDLNFSNRRMRTRMSGGVAGVRGQPRPLCRSGSHDTKNRSRESESEAKEYHPHTRINTLNYPSTKAGQVHPRGLPVARTPPLTAK